MNLKTNDRISELHEDVLANGYTKTQWWAMMKTKLDGAASQELISSAKAGLDYLLENEAVEALAITTYPWMTNQMEFTYEYGPAKGSKGVAPSWLEKIKSKGVTRPKDLLHLSRICEIAENIEAYDDMF